MVDPSVGSRFHCVLGEEKKKGTLLHTFSIVKMKSTKFQHKVKVMANREDETISGWWTRVNWVVWVMNVNTRTSISSGFNLGEAIVRPP